MQIPQSWGLLRQVKRCVTHYQVGWILGTGFCNLLSVSALGELPTYIQYRRLTAETFQIYVHFFKGRSKYSSNMNVKVPAHQQPNALKLSIYIMWQVVVHRAGRGFGLCTNLQLHCDIDENFHTWPSKQDLGHLCM